MTYQEAKKRKAELETQCKVCSDALNNFPKREDGLTPDAIKFSPQYRTALDAYRKASKKLRGFNSWFLCVFEKEYAAERLERRA